MWCRLQRPAGRQAPCGVGALHRSHAGPPGLGALRTHRREALRSRHVHANVPRVALPRDGTRKNDTHRLESRRRSLCALDSLFCRAVTPEGAADSGFENLADRSADNRPTPSLPCSPVLETPSAPISEEAGDVAEVNPHVLELCRRWLTAVQGSHTGFGSYVGAFSRGLLPRIGGQRRDALPLPPVQADRLSWPVRLFDD